MDEQNEMSRPNAEQLNEEIRRLQRRKFIFQSVRNSLGMLVVIAAVVTLVFTLWLPVMQVQRGSMTPTLKDGDIIVFMSGAAIKHGDIIAFQHGNQVLIKRVIAVGGDIVDIDDDGMVLLNGEQLDEPYITAFSAGERGTEMPCQVEDNQFFVLGDHRQTSIDSRSVDIGLVRRDQIVGKALIRVWPPNTISILA